MKGLLRCGLLNQTQPIMAKLARLLPPKAQNSMADDDEQQSPLKAGPLSAQQSTPQLQQTTPQQV